MKVKLEWLKELVDLEGIEVEEIVNKLSLYATEVEYASKIVDATNLVVGYVKECKKHENSDRLSVCQVDVGEETLQIVCGAPNVKQGQYVIVALPGATLPGGFKIKRAKLRGVESNGMICSLLELGIEKKFLDEENQTGIYTFNEPVKVGTDALQALNLADHVIELDLTPNRGDLLSMLGVAIEVSAIFNRPLNPLAFDVIKEENLGKLEVINETDNCLGYYGRVFRDVEIKPSPRWLISRLIAFGIRPINNCVDITNYILALFGQPLHAFDYDKLGSKILIRMANEGEEITTLDDVKRTLTKDDIVITDGIKPVALAGVMGGLDTEISDYTKNIVLEAAVFNSKCVRNTSTRLGLRSDSSIRFEKGVDLNRTKFALDYASYLLKKYASAKVGEACYAGIEKLDPVTIKITEAEVEKVLGIKINKTDIIEILKRLKFSVTNNLEVTVPTRRNDITIKEDLIEEIGRLYGYERLPLTLPKSASIGALTHDQALRRKMIDTLVGLGLNENITYSLVSKESNELFKLIQSNQGYDVELLMPLSQDRTHLRKTLLPSLIDCIKYSYNRKMKDIGIFEIGRVYSKNKEYYEEEHLAIAIANDYVNSLNHQIKVDFYLLKGIVEELFNKLDMEIEILPLTEKVDELHPGRSAEITLNGKRIGFLGALHPKFAKENDLDDVYVLEIILNSVYEYKYSEFKFNPIPKVPSVERDLAIVVKRDVLAGEIVKVIKNVKNTNVKEVNIFDVYTGDKVANDEKSIAINLVFETFETLTDEVINEKVDKIFKALHQEFNAELRA